MILLENQTTDTTGSTATLWDYSQQHIDYRPFTLLVSGTMNGATINIQVSNDKVTWLQAYSTTTTVGILFECTARYVRAVQSGSGASTNITVELT